MKEHNKNFYLLEELKRARDCYEGYQDGEEVFYFVGALRYACDEIERLNNIINEIREFIDKSSMYDEDGDSIVYAQDLFEILDKIGADKE